ncbi:CLUMA_CG006153, isoform A [Clunio marinus]|uniref:CLUMA_CG006153, isoform A n=1 Tax=Clunio marinus TaxID=568069 RepID=A0A1J1HYF7_9DIPT|nr:CLUMA_CG006153, isoform A [Clunio marinus]
MKLIQDHLLASDLLIAVLPSKDFRQHLEGKISPEVVQRYFKRINLILLEKSLTLTSEFCELLKNLVES